MRLRSRRGSASRPGGAQPAGLPVAAVLGLAAALELTLQAWRALFPLGYHLVGSLGFVVTPIVLTSVFLAPLLFWPGHRLLGRHLAGVVLVALMVARVVLQAQPSLLTAVVATVLGLLAVTALLPALASHRFGPDAVAAGTLVGLGLDVALRAWRATDDVVWSSGWSAWLDPSLVVPLAVLVACLPGLSRLPSHARTAPVWTWFVLLAPQLLLWTSPAFVGSSGGLSLSVTSVVLLLSAAAAMAMLAWPPARLSWHVSGLVVLFAALVIPVTSGVLVGVAAVAATVATPLLLRAATAQARQRPWSAARYAGAAGGGAVVMFVMLLLYPLHYEMPLPVSNAWLPATAVVLACLPLLRRPEAAVGAEFAVPSRVHRPAVALVAAGAVVVGAMVEAGMVGGSPLPGPDGALGSGAPRPGELRVATYNVGQGQDAGSGSLAFREVASVLAALDADVVAVQEVGRGWPLTSMADLDAWLRANTDWQIAFVPAADRQFGNALLARVPMTDVTPIDLGQQGGAQRRSAVRAVVPGGPSGDVLVYGMHLQARNTPAAEQSRLEQMRIVLADWDGRERSVLAGDLNPRNEYADATQVPPKIISDLNAFTDAGLVTSQPTQVCTQPTSNDNCSDYVFTSDDLARARPNEVVGVDVSDHRPVLAAVAVD